MLELSPGNKELAKKLWPTHLRFHAYGPSPHGQPLQLPSPPSPRRGQLQGLTVYRQPTTELQTSRCLRLEDSSVPFPTQVYKQGHTTVRGPPGSWYPTQVSNTTPPCAKTKRDGDGQSHLEPPRHPGSSQKETSPVPGKNTNPYPSKDERPDEPEPT